MASIDSTLAFLEHRRAKMKGIAKWPNEECFYWEKDYVERVQPSMVTTSTTYFNSIELDFIIVKIIHFGGIWSRTIYEPIHSLNQTIRTMFLFLWRCCCRSMHAAHTLWFVSNGRYFSLDLVLLNCLYSVRFTFFPFLFSLNDNTKETRINLLTFVWLFAISFSLWSLCVFSTARLSTNTNKQLSSTS